MQRYHGRSAVLCVWFCALCSVVYAAEVAGSSPDVSAPDVRGIVESFDDEPYTSADRLALMPFLGWNGFNLYLLAPRQLDGATVSWRAPLTSVQQATLTELASTGQVAGVELGWGYYSDAGLEYSSSDERERICQAFRELHQTGVRTFALLFRDAPLELQYGTDHELYPSLAAAQADLTNAIAACLYGIDPNARMLFGPVSSAASPDIPYVKTLGAKLDPQIHFLWSPQAQPARVVTASDVYQWNAALRRQVVFLDGYPSNAAQPKRMLLGPFTGRSPALPELLAGYLAQPMRLPAASQLPLLTLNAYFRNPRGYSPETALSDAIAALDPNVAGLRMLVRNSRESALLPNPEEPLDRYEVDRYLKGGDSGPIRDLLQSLANLPQSLGELPKDLQRDVQPLAQRLVLMGQAADLAVNLLDDARAPSAKRAKIWTRRVELAQLHAQLRAFPWESDPSELERLIEQCSRETDKTLGAHPLEHARSNMPARGDGIAANAIDDTLDKAFHSRRAVAAGDFLRVDFEQPVLIRQLQVYQADAQHPHDYLHLGRLDVVTEPGYRAAQASMRVYDPWVAAATLTQPTEMVNLPDVPLRALRLMALEAQDYALQVRELAFDMPLTSNATSSGEPLPQLVDGDLGTGAWIASKSSVDIDLSQPEVLAGLQLYLGDPGATGAWQLLASLNGEVYWKLGAGKGLLIDLEFKPQSVRYLRLANNGNAARVQEVVRVASGDQR